MVKMLFLEGSVYESTFSQLCFRIFWGWCKSLAAKIMEKTFKSWSSCNGNWGIYLRLSIGSDLTLRFCLPFHCMEAPLMKSGGPHDYQWSENLGSSLITEWTRAILEHCASHWENLSVTSKWPWVVGEMQDCFCSKRKPKLHEMDLA